VNTNRNNDTVSYTYAQSFGRWWAYIELRRCRAADDVQVTRARIGFAVRLFSLFFLLFIFPLAHRLPQDYAIMLYARAERYAETLFGGFFSLSLSVFPRRSREGEWKEREKKKIMKYKTEMKKKKKRRRVRYGTYGFASE
jgi:hypothetical protein